MINYKSEEMVNKSKLGEFTMPLLDSYCFSNIMGTIEKLLTGSAKNSLPKDTIGRFKEKKQVVFFLVDALGWKFYEKYRKESEFFKEIEKNGIVSKLTAQFPSATTSEITTAVTNVPVNIHGISDWYYYEPVVDDNIVAFMFNYTFKEGKENLKEDGFKAKDFLPRESFFLDLKKKGITSKVYQPDFINKSTYNKYMARGAEPRDYFEYKDLEETLLKEIDKEGEYHYVYIPFIDSIGHKFGESSIEFQNEVLKFLNFIDSFYKKIKDRKDIGIMLSADHGQIEQKEIIYLNKEYPNIYKYLKRNNKGDIYSPCGEARDVALHVKEEYVETLKGKLQEKLKDKAMILTLDECIEKGIFGKVSDVARGRLGNLYILPKGDLTIWFYEKDILEVKHCGVHGGLSKDEMEIPFLYIEN